MRKFDTRLAWMAEIDPSAGPTSYIDALESSMFPLSVPQWVPGPVQPIAEWAFSPPVLGVLSLASLVFFVGSILALPWLIARLPEDYFVDDDAPPSAVLRGECAAKFSRIVRNAIGIMLLCAGVAMLVLPGQGVLTIVVALGLIEFPGKRRIQRRLVARSRVLSTLNKIRARANKPPLILDREERDA